MANKETSPEQKAESRARTREALRHPGRWFMGKDMPEEKVRPWEMAAHILPNIVTGPRDGFTWNVMYLFQNVFKVNKRLQSVASVSSTVWDGLNDPLIGAYMDHRNWPISTHRKIMRWNVVALNILSCLPMFGLGMNAWQHVILLIIVNCLKSLFSTFNTVSSAKVWAHITPHSAERSKIAWASSIGLTIHEAIAGMYLMVIGLRDVLGWPENQIYLLGTIIFSIPALFLEMGPSFVLQRVPDTAHPEGEGKNFFEEMRECFSIIRYNKWFCLQMIARFITVFTPSISDNDYYRYCGVDDVIRMGKVKAETLLWVRNNFVALPGVVLQPFALPIIKKVGGARNMQVLHQLVATVANLSQFFVGMNSVGRILFNWGAQMLIWTTGKIDNVASNIIKYDMLDYVEYKTGRRSEGVTMAVQGLTEKLVINNVDVIVGNLVIDHLGFDPALEQKQPAKFYQWAPLLYLLIPGIDNFFFLLARLLYKYPNDLREKVEAELIERRRLAEEIAAEDAASEA
ncbi:MAG: MFS transporter [Oscillospiraceae bacterium]|jgi:Na+/melibiose symporter-like transporter|nr:MFS transporter [Oscillospiraceae bacterium]